MVLVSFIFLVVAGAEMGTPSAALAQSGPNLDEVPRCWLHSKPWRITLCKCDGENLGIILRGDGIYKQESSPCKAAVHAGVLGAGEEGIIAIEPHPGFESYMGSFRNDIKSHDGPGGPGYVVRPVQSNMDVEAEITRSAGFPRDGELLLELSGVWAKASGRYYFDGSRLIALTPVAGVDRARKGGYDPAPLRIFPAGTVVFYLSNGTSEKFVGHWLFENRFWGRVEGRLVHDGFLSLIPKGEFGQFGGLPIALFSKPYAAKESVYGENPSTSDSEIIEPLKDSGSFDGPTPSANICLRQSRIKDYCGPENSKFKSFIVADSLWGPFRSSCQTHDLCYYDGAKQIVSKLEQKYRMSLILASGRMKAEFDAEIDDLRSRCDLQFLGNLKKSCQRLGVAKMARCDNASHWYYSVVDILAKPAFTSAIDTALVCR